MTTQFKVGDKVRFINKEPYYGISRESVQRLRAAGVDLDGVFVVEKENDGGLHLEGLAQHLDGYSPWLMTERFKKVRTRKVVSKQGIFNHVFRFLLKQGRPAKNDGGCFYRASEEGGKVDEELVASDATLCCAAGCLISDAEVAANRDLMGYIWRSEHSEAFPRLAPFQDFIRELQKIHDRWKTLASWTNEMHAFAALHGLTVPAV